MKGIVIFLVISLLGMSAFSQMKYPKVPKSTNDATIKGKLEYPYHFKYDGNPLSRMHSAADPSVHVWDGVVWVITSQDRNMDSTKHSFHYAAMDGYHAFSSTDMINWTDHGEIFHSSDLNKSAFNSIGVFKRIN